MTFPLAAPLRTARAALLQMGARCLSLLLMALLAGLVVTGPLRAQMQPGMPGGGGGASCPAGFIASGNGQSISRANAFTIIAGGGPTGFEQCESYVFPSTKLVTFSWVNSSFYNDDGEARSASYTANGTTVSLGPTGQTTVTVNADSTITFRVNGFATSLAIDSYSVADAAPVAPPPVISALSPASGTRSGGDLSNQVIIYGSGFTADSTVWFGGKPATIGYQDATSIWVNFPYADTTGDVSVTVKNGSVVSNAKTFTYTNALLWTVVSPRTKNLYVEQAVTPITPVKPYTDHAGEGTITYSITPIDPSPPCRPLGLL